MNSVYSKSMNKILEVCTGSYEDCIAAYQAGAKRVELNSALYLGGLTPSVGTLKKVKENTNLKVICMIRPRGAGFYYSQEEYEIMLEDAKIFLEQGADGIAFGFLQKDSTIDISRAKTMVDLIHSYKKEAVFHRAFDVSQDPYTSIEQLIECKVDRVLSSGQMNTAFEGIDLLKKLQKKYGHLIEILPGSGINASNVKEFLGLFNQVHSSCKGYKQDLTSSFFSYMEEGKYEVVEKELVQEMLKIMEVKQ